MLIRIFGTGFAAFYDHKGRLRDEISIGVGGLRKHLQCGGGVLVALICRVFAAALKSAATLSSFLCATARIRSMKPWLP